ncbi:MAG: hypothetical protein JRE70_03690 [Deltaproteobacteria bacterium]|nr:hypothetical protein [Deltaproteobacteria bacterium]
MTEPVARPRVLLVGLLVAILTAYPPIASLWQQGTLGAFKYLAPDAFYYLAIADHSQGVAAFTFDGSHPTNGFHPLWQSLLYFGFGWLGPDQPVQLYFTMIASIGLVAVGTGFLGATALRLTGRPELGLLAAVPGFFYLVTPDFGPQFGAQWAFANGMETPLTVFFFGILAWWLLAGRGRNEAWTPRRLVCLSLTLTALILSRLDDVFLLVPFAAALALRADTRQRRAADLLRLGAIPCVVLVAYMIYNLVQAGALLPSSGAAKAQPLWALLRNTYSTLTTFVPLLDVLREPVSTWDSEAWRILQMILPAGVAVVWLHQVFGRRGNRRRPEEPWRRSLALLAAYVVLKAAYNFSVVGLWHQGWWYYPASIMTTNLIVAVWIGDRLDRASSQPPQGEGAPRAENARWLPAMVAVAVVCLLANHYAFVKKSGLYHQRSHTFWQERDAIRELIVRECDHCGVLAFDDGIVSYSLGDVSTLNGLGLTMDADAQAALSSGRLLDLAWQRGHRLFLSVAYPLPDDAWKSPGRLRTQLARNVHFAGVDLGRWDFEVAFRTPEGDIPLIRFVPAKEALRGEADAR